MGDRRTLLSKDESALCSRPSLLNSGVENQRYLLGPQQTPLNLRMDSMIASPVSLPASDRIIRSKVEYVFL